MVTGWHDLFLRDTIEDHRSRAEAGLPSRITVGPWSHISPGLLPYATRDALDLLDRVHGGRTEPERAPVRLFVQGLGAWRDYDTWPPAGRAVPLRLGVDGSVSAAPAGTGTRTVTHDPADPTPGAGGPGMGPPAGQVRQSAVEARADVLVHTGDALPRPLEIIGVVTAHVPVSSSATAGALVVVRLCDVDRRGVSRNVTEGVARLRPGAGHVDLELDPTAYHFRAGHRLRVHVAAGAYPRVAGPSAGRHELTVRYAPGAGPCLTLPVTDPPVSRR